MPGRLCKAVIDADDNGETMSDTTTISERWRRLRDKLASPGYAALTDVGVDHLRNLVFLLSGYGDPAEWMGSDQWKSFVTHTFAVPGDLEAEVGTAAEWDPSMGKAGERLRRRDRVLAGIDGR